MLSRTQKVEWATEFKHNVSKANLAVFANYRGLTAAAMDNFRSKIRKQGGEVKVLKNNVARKATADGELGSDIRLILDDTVGPTLVAFSYGDAAALAKVISQFAKENEALELRDSIMDRKKVSAADVRELASLPSREVLLARVLGTLNAPVANFVGVLAAVPRSLLNVLKALESKKSEGGQS